MSADASYRRLLACWLWAVCGAIADGQPAERSDYLATIPVVGGEPKRLVDEPGMHCGSPRWSPDGTRVAYDIAPYDDRFRDSCRVLVVLADGSGRSVIAAGGMPTWSPDGRDLAWHTYGGPGSIAVGRVDGAAAETLIDHWGNPVWLRDGRRILSIHGNGGLAAYDPVTGREAMVLTPDRHVRYGYSVSPDGRRVSYRTGQGELRIAPLDGFSPQRVRLSTGAVGYSSWSPDGRRLVVSWKPPGAEWFQLYTLSADGDDPPRRVPGQEEGVANLQPDWSPDGELLVYRRAAERR